MPTSVPTQRVLPNLPIATLPEFLDETEGLFDNIMLIWSDILFEMKDRIPLHKAWQELKNVFPSIKSGFANLKQSILEGAGLFGAQLEAKLNGLNTAWENFFNWGSVKKLKKLLGWVNVLLGSIAAIFAPVEAAKELVEVIEKSINQWED